MPRGHATGIGWEPGDDVERPVQLLSFAIPNDDEPEVVGPCRCAGIHVQRQTHRLAVRGDGDGGFHTTRSGQHADTGPGHERHGDLERRPLLDVGGDGQPEVFERGRVLDRAA